MVKKQSLVVCVVLFSIAFISIVFTIPDGFEHYGDMGTSATGVAIARSYYHGLTVGFQDPPGYVYNGEYTIYGNWPPIGFMVLAQWMKLLGDDSIFNARLLPSLLFAISTLLFFLLLQRLGKDLVVSIISTLLFTFLPYHLEFGKLIFSDMWLIPIWLLCLHLLISKKRYQWLIIPLCIVGSVGFMWFSFFAIPAMLTFLVLKRAQWSKGRLILFFLFGIIGIRLALWLLFNLLPEFYILSSLERWIQLPNISNGEVLFLVVKRIISLLYESLPVFALFFILIKKKGINGLLSMLKTDKETLIVLKFTILILFFYALVLPQWVVTHTYGVPFFSIAIGLVGALLLQASKEVFKRRISTVIGMSILVCSLILFSTYPYLSKAYQAAKPVKSTIQWMDQREGLNILRSCVYFNLGDEIKWSHAFEFGIKEETNSYIFSNDSLSFSNLPKYLEDGMNKLRMNRSHDFDSTKAIFITSTLDDLEGFNIIDSIKIDGINVYEIEL